MAGGADNVFATAQRIRREAEGLVARLPPLTVSTRQIAATLAPGVHGRRRTGQGDSFWQFRRYQSGDAATVIDWRQSARSQHLFVRETEWEAAQTVWLWRDGSPSMAWRSHRSLPTKRQRADVLLTALALLLWRGGERVRLLGQPGSADRGNTMIDRLATILAAGDNDGDGLPDRDPLPAWGQVVLLGDFLGPLEETGDLVRHMAAQRLRGHIMQILDPAEETLPFEGRIRFEGLEGEGEVVLQRAEASRALYRERLAAQRAGLARLTRSVDWTFSVHGTDRPGQSAMLSLYSALAGTGGA